MIEIDGIKYQTEAQWNAQHRAILKRQRGKGIQREWYIDLKHKAEAVFYREEQTRPYNQRELNKAKRIRREMERTRKQRLSCSCCGEYFGRYARYELKIGLCEFCRKDHTSWQWLYVKHLAPKKNAEPYEDRPWYWNPWINNWEASERTWFYYKRSQVHPVSDEQFEDLKEKYIQLYGGWEEIDLEHTKYNGKKWW